MEIKKTSYAIVEDAKTPNSKQHNFVDAQEEGIAVLECESGKLYVMHSTFMAKTIRQFQFGIFNSSYLSADNPRDIRHFYKLDTSQAKTYGASPDIRRSKQVGLAEFHDAIFLELANELGADKVVSERWLQYGAKGHESKTNFIDSHLTSPKRYYQSLLYASWKNE